MVKEGDKVRAWIDDEYSPVKGEFGTVDNIDDAGNRDDHNRIPGLMHRLAGYLSGVQAFLQLADAALK